MTSRTTSRTASRTSSRTTATTRSRSTCRTTTRTTSMTILGRSQRRCTSSCSTSIIGQRRGNVRPKSARILAEYAVLYRSPASGKYRRAPFRQCLQVRQDIAEVRWDIVRVLHGSDCRYLPDDAYASVLYWPDASPMRSLCIDNIGSLGLHINCRYKAWRLKKFSRSL